MTNIEHVTNYIGRLGGRIFWIPGAQRRRFAAAGYADRTTRVFRQATPAENRAAANALPEGACRRLRLDSLDVEGAAAQIFEEAQEAERAAGEEVRRAVMDGGRDAVYRARKKPRRLGGKGTAS